MVLGRVLIADDSKTMGTFVESALEQMGHFSVDVVHDGSKALNAVLNSSYSLVILDHDMPGMKGLDVIRAIHKLRPTSCPALVLITATVYPEIVAAIRDESLPVSSVIAKPFTLNEFRARIEKVPQKRSSPGTPSFEGSEPGIVYYKESPRLAIKVLNTGPFVAILFRGNGTNDDMDMLKSAFNTVIAAKPNAVVANVSDVTDFDEAFLGFLIIFMGTVIDNGRKAFLVIGEKTEKNRFFKLGIGSIFQAFSTTTEFREQTENECPSPPQQGMR
jgi:CheY-like chemotaxis protein